MDQQKYKKVLWKNILRGHVETMILKVLQNGHFHGYGICEQIAKDTEGAFDLKEATLYACLRRLEKEGKVASFWDDPQKENRRKYYATTKEGTQAYTIQREEWKHAIEILQKLI